MLAGMFFAYSGYVKLLEPSSNFTAAILGYHLVDVRTASLLASTLPWAELVAGVFFVAGLWTWIAMAVLWILNIVFLGAVSSALIRHIPLQDCGCFGEGSHALPLGATLGIDAGLFLLFLVVLLNRKEARALSLDRKLEA